MKVEVILFFLLFLSTFHLILRKDFSFRYIIAIIAAIGFSPYFWDFKDNILSELPFLFFLYLGFFLIHRAPQSYNSKKAQILYVIITGVVIYLTYGTRGIGILLLFLLFYDALRFKKPIWTAVLTAFVFGLFMALQALFLHKDSVYLNEFIVSPKLIASHLYWYMRGLPVFWDNGYNKFLRYILFMIFSMLASVGYLVRVRKNMTVLELFPILYIISVIIWPAFAGMRFLIPLIPLYVYYGFEGVRNCENKWGKKIYFIILVLFIFGSYIAKYATLDYGPINEGVEKVETVQLFDFIKHNTSEEDIFIFKRPRILSLYTGRNASTYHCPLDDRDLWGYFDKIHATYVIVGKPFDAEPDTDKRYLASFVRRYKANFEEKYSNPDFKLYKIKR